MSQNIVDIFYQIVAFLFAISVHESAHAWTANRCGDPTARMLGRVSLNPVRHVDPIGTVLIPALAMFSGVGFIGWAKPTPVDPRNFKKPVQYDILTSVAGPVSNFLVATLAILVLAVLSALFPSGRETIRYGLDTGSVLVPVVAMLYALVSVNILLAVFNLIPIPPLDGSHVIRHLLPESAQRAYDTMGMVGLILLFVIGRPILRAILPPVMGVFSSLIRVVT